MTRKKLSRKAQLERRSYRYATSPRRYYAAEAAGIVAEGFEDGYRVALKDVRKLIAECRKGSAGIADPIARITHRNHCVRVRVERFIRPLR